MKIQEGNDKDDIEVVDVGGGQQESDTLVMMRGFMARWVNSFGGISMFLFEMS